MRSSMGSGPVISTFLCLVLLISSAGAGEAPTWLTIRPSDSAHYYGTGSASEKDFGDRAGLEAEKRALESLSMEISTTVTVDISTRLRESGGTIDQDSSFYSRAASLYSASELENVQIIGRYTDRKSGDHYALARLSKSELEASFRNRETAVLAKVHENIVRTETAFAEGACHSGVSLLVSSLQDILLTQAATGRPLNDQEFGDAAVQERIRSAAQSLVLELEAGGSQKGERGSGLTDEIRGRAVFRTVSGLSACRDLPLSLSLVNAEGRFSSSTVYTGRDGEFTFRVTEISSAKSSTPFIRVHYSPDLTALPSSTADALSQSFDAVDLAVPFTIDTKGSTVIFIHIYEMFDGDHSNRSTLQTELAKALVREKFRVADHRKLRDLQKDDLNTLVEYEAWEDLYKALEGIADFAVTGYLNADPDQDTGSGLVFAVADAAVTVLDLRSRRVVAAQKLNEVEGDGYDAASAMNSAAERCRDELLPKIVEDLRNVLK